MMTIKNLIVKQMKDNRVYYLTREEAEKVLKEK